MKTQHLFAAVLALLVPVAASWGAEPEAPETAIPRMDSARMEMQWNDLRSLLEELYAARSREFEKEEPAPPPPYDWTISEARYEAGIEPGNSMRVRAEFDIDVLNDACWARIPILKNTVAPVDASLNGEPVSLSVDADGWLMLAIQKPGFYAFETTFYTDIAASEGVLTAQFPCARTPVTRMTLAIPVKDAQVVEGAALGPLEEDQLQRRLGDGEVGVAGLALGGLGGEQLRVEVDGLVEVADVEGELESGHGFLPVG